MQAHVLGIPDPCKRPSTADKVGCREGGAWVLSPQGWEGTGEKGGGGAGVRTHALGRRLPRAEPFQEKECIQRLEGKGKNVLWCLTRGEEGGQGGRCRFDFLLNCRFSKAWQESQGKRMSGDKG